MDNDTNISNFSNKIINLLLNGTDSPLDIAENFNRRFNLTTEKNI